MPDNWDAVARDIGNRLAELGLTQLDLAARSGVSPATIRELQRNRMTRRRNPRTLEALSEALDWPPDHLSGVLAGSRPETRAPSGTNDAVLRQLDDVLDQLRDLRSRIEAIERQQER